MRYILCGFLLLVLFFYINIPFAEASFFGLPFGGRVVFQFPCLLSFGIGTKLIGEKPMPLMVMYFEMPLFKMAGPPHIPALALGEYLPFYIPCLFPCPSLPPICIWWGGGGFPPIPFNTGTSPI